MFIGLTTRICVGIAIKGQPKCHNFGVFKVRRKVSHYIFQAKFQMIMSIFVMQFDDYKVGLSHLIIF